MTAYLLAEVTLNDDWASEPVAAVIPLPDGMVDDLLDLTSKLHNVLGRLISADLSADGSVFFINDIPAGLDELLWERNGQMVTDINLSRESLADSVADIDVPTLTLWLNNAEAEWHGVIKGTHIEPHTSPISLTWLLEELEWLRT